MSTQVPPEPGTVACPRCGASVSPDQDWCLVCGAAARTRLAPTPNWKLPVAALAGIVAVSLVALALAFVALTNDDPAATGATGPTGPTATAPAPVPVVPPAPTGPTVGTPAPGASGATGAKRPRSGATGTT